MYFNVHTSTYPGGEIRGQVLAKNMPPVVTALIKNSPNYNVSVFPNPASAYTEVSFETSEAGNAFVTVLDMNGTAVITKSSIIYSGFNRISIDLNIIKPGVYHIQVSSNNSIITSRKITIN